MRRRREDLWRSDIDKQTALLDEVRAALRERGPLGHRDFAGHARVNSYRARTAAGLALFHLWLTGELMTHSRRRFERLYAFREDVAPPADNWVASDAEAQEFHARKALRTMVFVTPRTLANRLSYCLHRKVPLGEAGSWLSARQADGQVAAVTIDDVPAPHRGPYVVPRDHLALLEELERGAVPAVWRPLASSTEDEVTLVAPLDPALDRARTRALFDFEYVWEVYKPAPQRRWGYYAMPILWGDRYVGRVDPKVDRIAGTLVLNGLWLEAEELATDARFASALAGGLAHLARFAGARTIDVEAVQPSARRALHGKLDTRA
jgi:uncharacterized protein YcaQ